jgi:hypothetical protein
LGIPRQHLSYFWSCCLNSFCDEYPC